MVLIVKKLVPVYKPGDKVPKKYLNLRKAVYVTTFKYPYPNMAQILQEQYGLRKEGKIIVFWMKEISLPHFNRYRMKFRKVYSGPLKHLAPSSLEMKGGNN
ncbi:MAG: hypothetical protein IIA60_09335 [Candidatus Marinimicrobia bacterium]|nr:hypothetical protein [Candidatus Neomarinimicrobiota bacterium]